MSTSSKFALCSFAGKPRSYFQVEAENLSADPSKKAVPKPSHHIIIVDRSGSMYGDMDPLKTMVEKVLTLSEFNSPSLRVSLLSYSSMGDVKVHFKRELISDVMAANSPFIKEIRSIRATCMTCISQSLVEAEKLVQDSETTSISLHTDGFANDRSPSSEFRAIQAAVDQIKKHPCCFVNTIAYRDWCDFGLLSNISNQCSGTCIQARDIKQVYTALYDTTKLVAGAMAPVVEIPMPKGGGYALFVSTSAKKVLGAEGALTVQGLAPADDKTAYRLFPMSEAEYNKSMLPVCGDTAPITPVLAYCRALISEGRLNDAKYALVSSRHTELLVQHARALVSTEIAAMASDVETAIFTPKAFTKTASLGLPTTGPSLLAVLAVLDEYRSSLTVDMKPFTAGYKRRGLKKVSGVRNPDGSLTEPAYETKPKASTGFVKVGSFEFNRNTATINVLLFQPVDLIEKATGNVIPKVAGITLDLSSFNNYTLVGDGVCNSPEFPIRTTDKRCFKALKDMGMVTGDFNPDTTYVLPFGKCPLVEYDQDYGIKPTVFPNLLGLQVVSKLLSAVLKSESTKYTPEQVAELKTYLLTSSLYFSPPTTSIHPNLDDAIAKGDVDTRLSYKIELGTPKITNLGKLLSGNAFLQRRFTVKVGGKEVDKPTLDLALANHEPWGVKKLSGKTTLDDVDALCYPIYAEFLGLESNGMAQAQLALAGLTKGEIQDTLSSFQSPTNKDKAVETLTTTLRKVDDMIDRLFKVEVSPLVFYIGATGLIPESLGASKALTADQIEAKYPGIKLAKAEKEDGVFYVLPGDILLTVFIKGEYFTVKYS